MSDVLKVQNLSVTFKKNNESFLLVDDVSFSVKAGRCLGILGESGSGKSMICKALIGVLDRSFTIEGNVFFDNKDLLKLSQEQKRVYRGKKICMILQNPMACFDMLYRIGYQMKETFLENTNLSSKEIDEKCIEILKLMHIKNPLDVICKYPHQLSGGTLQRIMIGIAIFLEPEIIIADEPTTAIDSITQYEIIQEFINIKKTKKSALIFVSHDLGVISKLADDVIVMHDSKLVERGSMGYIFKNANDEYTKMLIEKVMSVTDKFNSVMKIGNQNDL